MTAITQETDNAEAEVCCVHKCIFSERCNENGIQDRMEHLWQKDGSKVPAVALGSTLGYGDAPNIHKAHRGATFQKKTSMENCKQSIADKTKTKDKATTM